MQTGMVESWVSDPNLLGPLYPFVGTEMLWVLICVAVWLGWTVWQMRFEAAHYAETAARLKKGKALKKAVESMPV